MNKCTNANRGTFNHECGKPAEWIGTHANGHRQRFCDHCRQYGDEARHVTDWTRYTPERWNALAAEDRRQAALAVYCDY